jgi:hypothetical protein
MTNPIKRVYAEDGSFKDIEMTAKEASEFAKWQKEKIAQAEAKMQELTVKVDAKAALLDRLGITAEEAQILLS